MIQAVGNRIVLKPEVVKDNINGVYIPETSLKKPQRGIVETIGADVREVKVGMECVYLMGHGLYIDDKVIIKEDDILGYYTNQ